MKPCSVLRKTHQCERNFVKVENFFKSTQTSHFKSNFHMSFEPTECLFFIDVNKGTNFRRESKTYSSEYQLGFGGIVLAFQYGNVRSNPH